MANKGKRMVFEEDIKKIGQGGGTEYTASNGVKIVDNDIQADTTVMATKIFAQVAAREAVEDGAIQLDKAHYFVELPGDYNGDMDAWFKDIPVLQTNGFTDADTFGHPVIEGNQNAGGFKYLDLCGTYLIRDTANNKNQLITTYGIGTIYAEDTAYSRAGNLAHFLCFRTGNNDWSCEWVRNRGTTEFRYLDEQSQPQVYATAIWLTRSIFFGFTSFNANGISGQSVDLRIAKLKPNYNAAVATPTTEGTYKLNVHVDADGQVDLVSWVAENQ